MEGAERPDVSGETYQKTFESKTRRKRERRGVGSSERATLRARRPRLEIPLIYFNNVSKVYGRDTVALDQVNLGIESGEFVFEGVKAGAMGYLLKDASLSELVSGIWRVHEGESLIQPAVASSILFELASSRGQVQDTPNGKLTFPFTIRNQVTTSLSSLCTPLAITSPFPTC